MYNTKIGQKTRSERERERERDMEIETEDLKALNQMLKLRQGKRV